MGRSAEAFRSRSKYMASPYPVFIDNSAASVAHSTSTSSSTSFRPLSDRHHVGGGGSSTSTTASSTPTHEQEERLAHLITHWNPTINIDISEEAEAAEAASAAQFGYGGGATPAGATPSSHHHHHRPSLIHQHSTLSSSSVRRRPRLSRMPTDELWLTVQHQNPSHRRKSHRSCRRCGVKDTPQWRPGPDGTLSLCNVCGLVFEKRKKRGATSW